MTPAAAALLLLPALVFSAGPELAPKVPETLGAPLPGDPLKTTIHRLSNGLTVYLSPNHERPRIFASIAVRAGSKDDPAESTGMAHYLEHMLFKGSSALGTLDYGKEKPHLERILSLYEKRFGETDPSKKAAIYKEIDAENIAASRHAIPNELDKTYKELGFEEVNAYTSYEDTVYVCDMPSNRVEAWARMEAERFARPVFRLFQSELEAVYEEKNRWLDNANRILFDALHERLYRGHPYGRAVLGTIEHLKNPSLAKMYEFYGRYYVPNNMAIALSGDFERGKMLELIERHFGEWKPKPLPALEARDLPRPSGLERVDIRYEAEESVVVAWPAAPARHADTEALMVMDMIMDNAAAGILNLTLNQAQKVKGSGSTLQQPLNEGRTWYLWAVPKLSQSLEEAEALLMEAVGSLKRGEFSDDDIRAVVTNFEVIEKERLESNEARAEFMASSFARLEPWDEAVGRLNRLRRVSKEDVVGAANKYLGDNRVVAYRRAGKPELHSVAKPGFTRIEIDPARQSPFAAELLRLPARPLEPRWLAEGRDYTITPLPSGKLIAAKNPFNDLFSLSLNFERGSRHRRGLCAAFNLLELSGAGPLAAEEYKKKLYSLGVSIGYECGEQKSAVTIAGLDKNLEASLDLMLARFAAPHVATDTLKKMVEVELGARQDRKKDPASVHGALEEWAGRGKDSAVLAQLSDAELKALTTQGLADLIREVLDFKRRTAYVGNRRPSALVRLLRRKDRGPASAPFREPPSHIPLRFLRPGRDKVYFTHRDMVQSRVGLFAADEILDPDHHIDYLVYSGHMGGGMSSILFQEIREARSLAYDTWGQYGDAWFKGDENQVFGGLGCQADKTVEAAALLRGLFQAPPLSEKRFRAVRQSILEDYRTNPIGFRRIPRALMIWEDEGIPGGDPRPKRYRRALDYRLDDFKTFAARLKGRPMTLYILGHRDRAGLAGLKALGDFEEKSLDQIFPY